MTRIYVNGLGYVPSFTKVFIYPGLSNVAEIEVERKPPSVTYGDIISEVRHQLTLQFGLPEQGPLIFQQLVQIVRGDEFDCDA